MSDLYESRNSIYCYKDTNILVNKLNIMNQEKLNEKDSNISAVKMFNLRQNKMIGKFDIPHFIGIHKYIFEDLYPFAGLFRTENIAKGNFSFAEWNFIESELNRILNELKSENYLKDLDKTDLAKGLAYYLSELNVLHPFREGNGRTIREFIRQLAYKNNYILDLRRINPKDLLNATIKSVVDTSDLEQLIFICLDKIIEWDINLDKIDIIHI